MLRVKGLLQLLCAVLLTALCGFATWRSVRIAIADWVASAGTLDAFERATRFARDDARLLARTALYRNDNGDTSPTVDETLERAARINPLDSNVLMTLGLRAEFRGDSAKAEGYLVRAAEIDHQFKPAWTLANYYYRARQPEKGSPMIQRILKLDPLGYDPMPVFELYWRQATNDQADADQVRTARKILGYIPKRGHKPIQFLEFLVGARRTEPALDVWPEALAAADPANSYDVGQLTGFADFLTGADRLPEAVRVWNQLVDRGIVHSGHLYPAKGVSIADPDFSFASLPTTAPTAFGWRVADIPGVFASSISVSGTNSSSLRFEINGDEPQSFLFLSSFAPVLSATHYHLAWKSDGTSLSAPHDPGFRFEIVQQPGDVATQCPPLLSPGSQPVCDFVTPEHGTSGQTGQIQRARIDLRYTRAQGTTRVSGALQLLNVRLEFAR
jgi:tetratricopeptide (TPR) repeat protein